MSTTSTKADFSPFSKGRGVFQAGKLTGIHKATVLAGKLEVMIFEEAVHKDAANVPPPAAPEPDSVIHWIRLIQQIWSPAAGRTLELARAMSRARRSLPYGSWSRLWQPGQLPFSKRKGEKLVVIGHALGGLDANNCSHLPAAWNTLYGLARLGRAKVEQLIQKGRIHPGLTLRQVRMLPAGQRLETPRKASGSKLQVRLARFADFVRSGMSGWTREDQDFAGRQLLALAGEIQRSTRDADLPGPGLRSLNSRPFAPFADPVEVISQVA